uniref:Uncharacterized protein n=1 Tax=Oryza rufipogon TaxID=4529 RepID=A0A0E0Q0F3_ORYRU
MLNRRLELAALHEQYHHPDSPTSLSLRKRRASRGEASTGSGLAEGMRRRTRWREAPWGGALLSAISGGRGGGGRGSGLTGGRWRQARGLDEGRQRRAHRRETVIFRGEEPSPPPDLAGGEAAAGAAGSPGVGGGRQWACGGDAAMGSPEGGGGPAEETRRWARRWEVAGSPVGVSGLVDGRWRDGSKTTDRATATMADLKRNNLSTKKIAEIAPAALMAPASNSKTCLTPPRGVGIVETRCLRRTQARHRWRDGRTIDGETRDESASVRGIGGGEGGLAAGRRRRNRPSEGI